MSQIAPINNYKDRVKLSEAIPLSSPFSVFVFPTTYCNFRCVYCAHSMSAEEMREKYGLEERHMDMETYRLVLAQMKEFPDRVKLLSLTGQGEPMLNKNLPEMVRMAKQADAARRIEIISNGSLLTHEMSDALIDAGLDGLRISLQGLDAEKYREICGAKLNFDEYIDNLRYFYTRKGTCELFVKIMDVALDGRNEADFYRVFDPITDRMYVERCRPVYDGVAFTDGLRAKVMDRYGNEHPPRRTCPLCFFQMAVFPNGDVAPCDAIYMPIRLGNVHKDTLRRMFTSDTLLDFQRRHLRGARGEMRGCDVCCAPDDVSHPLDALDDAAGDILLRMENSAP